MRSVLILSILLLVACPKSKGVQKTIASSIPASAPATQSNATTAPTPPTKKEPADETFTLKVGEKRLSGGVEILYSNRRHKHAERFTTGIIEVKFTQGEESRAEDFRGEGDILRGEWSMFGKLIAAETNASNEDLIVTVYAKEPRLTALTTDEAIQQLRDEAKKRGLNIEGDSASQLNAGIFSHRMDTWRGEIGIWSGRIYQVSASPRK